MDHNDNINYRRSLEKKVFEKKKLTSEEKWWLNSNPMFNERYSFPCLKSDIIVIPKNQEITMHISVLRSEDNTKIYRPVICVVGKGEIKVENQLFDFNMNRCTCKSTRMLIPLFDENRSTISVRVSSQLGLVSVAYQCEYFDDRMNLYVQEISDGPKLSYGMKKSDVSDNEFVYYCKNPCICDDNFESYAFSIKTEIIALKQD